MTDGRQQNGQDKPVFNREAVFAEVEESNRRFDDYTAVQRRAFAENARALRPRALHSHEVRRR